MFCWRDTRVRVSEPPKHGICDEIEGIEENGRANEGINRWEYEIP